MKDNEQFYTFRGYQMLKHSKKILTPSMEDYMEMIYKECMREGYIRVNQLAEQLNVQAPSATKNVQKLAELGLLDYEKYGIIRLTDKGYEIGRSLLERHNIIETFLKKIGVEKMLLNDTEMIEHCISQETLMKIQTLNRFMDAHPDIMDKYRNFSE